MKYPRILAAIRSAKWAATPATVQAIADTLGSHLRGNVAARIIAPKIQGPFDEEMPPRLPVEKPGEVKSNGVAVIPVYGILGKHLSSMETMCGGCDVDAIASELSDALSDTNISAILFDFDSPGGVVTGVPELAAKIRAANEMKPCYAFTATQCCSGAYWLASACTAFFCTSTADIGSIGVYVAMVDESEWWKKEGYKLELIKAGTFKAMGIAGAPLKDEERALIQNGVDDIYSMFTSDVQKGRGSVDSGVMQGQTFMGEKAIAAHLADELVGDIEEVISQIANSTLSASN